MNPQLPPLIELQALDLRIVEIKELQRKTPELIASAEAPLREATRLLKEATVSVEALTKERRGRERDLEAHEAQTEKLKARLTELKTNKEYQAYLFEIEMANKKKGEIEEQILVLMEGIETKQQEVKRAQAKVAEAERQFAQEKNRLEALAAGLVKELAELEEKQRVLTATVDKELLDRYAKLKAARKDLALAPVRDGICCGCRLQLPPQLVAEVKRSDVLQTCSYCHRILYWEGEPVNASVVAAEPLDRAEDDMQETV
ncbi:MAG: hypothetical protein HY581_06625 [Nitrospirae bacterium]|nr:hypothetical protein [Nitrospirota bacterium]